jgi:hypothetical protein
MHVWIQAKICWKNRIDKEEICRNGIKTVLSALILLQLVM